MAPRKRSLSRVAALGMAAAAVALLTSCTPGTVTGTPVRTTPTTANPPSSPPRTPTEPTGSTPTTAGAPARADGCRSLPVSPTVKADVTTAYGDQAQPPLRHITPVKGTFYYGSCGKTFYAATRFQLTPGSTEAEQVALQDDGSVMKYFIDRPGTAWTFLAGDTFPASPSGCAAVPEIPSHLSTLWNDCRP
ncbi:hypothetical protein ABZ307_31445 [Streptomyces griseorubiginosus]|uniref:hypothetical protein n=1 Tax=Streptomyces griseorubiginosus TaxID=67304 RepID=UPI0033BF8129